MIYKNNFINTAYERGDESSLNSTIYRFVSAALVGIFKNQYHAETKRAKEQKTANTFIC